MFVSKKKWQGVYGNISYDIMPLVCYTELMQWLESRPTLYT